MLQIYDLYDLSAIYAIIRAHPNYDKNHAVIKSVISVLESHQTQHDCNQFRKALRTITNIDKTKR